MDLLGNTPASPGFSGILMMSAGGAKDSHRLFRPYGAPCRIEVNPRAAPGAKICRRSAAQSGRGFRCDPRLNLHLHRPSELNQDTSGL
jgi:hypothetical protein